ncbi:MAG: hypothetical protein KF881_08490 [Acidobacteria bacterium]|nr:hypothetical protein [Acidobacteriota bacterium]
MWGKIYLGFLTVSAVLICFFSYYAFSWLNSIGSPQAAFDGYAYHSAIAEFVLWSSTLGLIALANGVLWTTGRVWAMWTTFFYFLIFKLGGTLWLGNALSAFAADAGGQRVGVVSSLIVGVVLTALIGAILYFDQFIVTKMRQRTLGGDDTLKIAGEIAEMKLEKPAEKDQQAS